MKNPTNSTFNLVMNKKKKSWSSWSTLVKKKKGYTKMYLK